MDELDALFLRLEQDLHTSEAWRGPDDIENVLRTMQQILLELRERTAVPLGE